MDIIVTKDTTLESVFTKNSTTQHKTLSERYREGESFIDLMRERTGPFAKQRLTLRKVVSIFLEKYYGLEIRLNLLEAKFKPHNGNRSIKIILDVLKIELKECIKQILVIKEMKDNIKDQYRAKSDRLFPYMANHYHLREEIEFLEKHLDNNLSSFRQHQVIRP